MKDHGSAPSPDPVAPSSAGAEGAHMPERPLAGRYERTINIDGQTWIAYTSGRGAYGTGHWGLAAVEAIHFALASAPEEPLFEALAGSNRLAFMFDRELETAFRNARRIVKPEPGTVAAQSRRFGLSDQ